MTVADDILLPDGARILHIGPPKTGTSSVQAAFFAAREEAARQGVFYASEGKHGMSAVLAALDLPSPWSPERRPPPRWRWTRMLALIKGSSANRTLLSSEFLSFGGPVAIRRVVDELDPQRVQVVVTLRPLARILPSQWQQWVQNREATAFEEFVRGLFETPPRHATFWHRHRHDQLVARWADIVGADRMTVIALDDANRDTVLRVFEGLTGLRSGTLESVDDASNRSMTLPEIETVRAFNVAYGAEKLPKPLYLRLMRYGAAAHMRQRTPAPDEPRIELPAWAIDVVAERSREMVAAIAASGVRIVGNLDDLTKVPPAPAARTGPVTVSPEIAASAAMGIVLASGLARGTGATTSADAEGQAPDEALQRAPRPVQEPYELLRISTLQLAVVLVRRVRAAAVDRVMRPIRRGSGRG